MEMHPPQQHFRIKVADLKAHLIRKLGPGLSKQYFYYLNKFLSLKISKVEFNKICCRILGRGNIPLHNHFIRSILKNACSAKHPPLSHISDDVNALTTFGSKKETPTDLYLQNGSHNATSQASLSHGFSKGDMLPLSPRKARTGYRDRRSGDLHSTLGANGKTNLSSQHFDGKELSDRSGALENGFCIPADVQGLVHQHEKLMMYAENERAASAEADAELSEERGVLSVYNRNQIEGSIKQEGNELYARTQLRAPLGFAFSPDNVCLAHKAITLPSKSKCVTALNSGLLLDNMTLQERLEQIAASQGLEGLSTDCVSILNNGLDAYLKGLIRSCVKLVNARSGQELIIKNNKFPAPSKLANGFRPGHNIQIHNSSKLMEVTPEHISNTVVSLQDFRVAMELNPQQLGENWPLLLEKICLRSYDE